MKRRIDMITSYIQNAAKTLTAEESWYSHSQKLDAARISFWVPGGVELMQFFFPRELTELIPSPYNSSGYHLKIDERMKDWDFVSTLDVEKYLSLWPRNPQEMAQYLKGKITIPEVIAHEKTLMQGWFKLMCAWWNDSIPAIAYQLPWWENYLVEELRGFGWLYHEAVKKGLRETIANHDDGSNFLPWLKIASCCVEILSYSCPTILAVIRIDRGQNYPALWAGHQWMKHHQLKTLGA